MTPFTLPTPNDPADPPPDGDVVVVWHRRHGMIPATRDDDGWWWSFPERPDDLRGTRLRPAEIVGWWPEPRPLPRHVVACTSCAVGASLRMRPDRKGEPIPDASSAPEGWTRTYDYGDAAWAWHCPRHGTEWSRPPW
jgi:hypothetical protein